MRRTLILSVAAAVAGLVFPIAPAHGASTVQAAIDAASPGSSVAVPARTYTEEVVVEKDLTLVGAGVGRTVIKAPTLTHFAVPRTTAPVQAIDCCGAAARVLVT